LVYRSDRNRSKIIASNLQQIIIVIAIKPNFNPGFLDSCLLSAESSSIQPLILINKMDLAESASFAEHINQLYRDKLGYQTLQLSALNECQQLLPYLHGKRSLLIGQSGMGKSTLTNQICPAAAARIGEITKYETSGAHTTTNASLYHIDATSDLIDCPGLQEFGLFHLESDQLAEYFPEMRDSLGLCKFSNCRHLQEPGCEIRTAMEAGKIDRERYNFYQRIAAALKTKKSY
jgi:ribosome biogenesis GTPase